ncbi:MAG: protein kinase [Eubacterium sp.]|nr:protein kinase [Eubacterium sp.]
MLEPLIKSFGKIHASGLIHRDLSPDNIMMLSDGSVRLIDFGNARDVTNGKSMTLAMKQGFAAPEQYKSRGQGTWTDVYGICATVYYCLTGKLPPQAMERLTGAPFPTPTELGVDILPQWESAIMDGLDLFVKSRIQTMDELWERIYKEPDIADEELLSEQMTVVHTTDATGNIQRDVTTIPTQQLTAKKYSSQERIQWLQERFLQMRAKCVEVFKRMKEK